MIGNAVNIATSKMPEDFGGNDEKNAAAKSLGQGGGKVRAMALSAKRRREIDRDGTELGRALCDAGCLRNGRGMRWCSSGDWGKAPLMHFRGHICLARSRFRRRPRNRDPA